MAYAIGLDCGITSVGWCVMEVDENEEPIKIKKLNSRIFPAAENPKTGASLSKPRRDARGIRRVNRRRRHRKERIDFLLQSQGVINKDELNDLYKGTLEDIYELRTVALDKLISRDQFVKVLRNYAQRRGFKSNRKHEKKGDDGKLLLAVSANEKLMQEKGYRTVGEMFFKDAKFAEKKRNTTDSYMCTVSRADIEKEVKLVFDRQRNFGNKYATQELEKQYLEILLSQRSFAEGPGEPSPYSGVQIENMIGPCTFYPEEKRAVKATYSFEYFNLLQKVNNIRIFHRGEKRNLTDSERKLIIEKAHKSQALDYSIIRSMLNLDETEYFATVNYNFDKEIDEIEKKAKFQYLSAYHEMRKVLDKIKKDFIKTLSIEKRDKIAYIFTVYRTDSSIKKALKEERFDEIVIEALLNLKSFSKTSHLSLRAIKQITPFLEKGMRYDEACKNAGIDFRAHNKNEKSKFLPSNSEELNNITNPVVKRAFSQTTKVINAIIREQGESPCYINVELARELSKSLDDRRDVEKKNEENKANNEKIKDEIIENFGMLSVSGQDIVKLKLWKSQDGISPYSQKPIKYERLFEDGYAEIDHIIPYSISFNDSYNNKVLVLSEENRQKTNRLPMEYLSGKEQENFVVWVENNIKNLTKKRNLLKTKITEEDKKFFKERNLNDTKYLSKVLYNFINDNLEFNEVKKDKKRRVNAVNGAATAYIRKRWGIHKIREEGDLHHAVDACVIACTTNAFIQKISRYAKINETAEVKTENGKTILISKNTGEVINEDLDAKFPQPYNKFRDELVARTSEDPSYFLKSLALPTYTKSEIEEIKQCFVSRKPNRKVTGPAHEDTIFGEKNGVKLLKTKLVNLKLDKDGEIKNYYNPSSDILLYEALKKRLQDFEGDGKEAFKESFYKPKSDGTKGPVVKSVKLINEISKSVSVRDGIGQAKNDTMVRIDIFYVYNDGYYFVPIYVADTVKDKLPNKACVRSKPCSEWKEMDDKDFLFSVYPNDLIYVESNSKFKLKKITDKSVIKEKKSTLLYYIKSSINTASITVINHDKTYKLESLGIKKLSKIKKCQIDVLGNVHFVEKEKRQDFSNRKRK